MKPAGKKGTLLVPVQKTGSGDISRSSKVGADLILSRTKINFGQTTNGTEAVEQVTITNPGSVCVTYKWYIQPESTQVKKNPRSSESQEIYFEKYRPARFHYNPSVTFVPGSSGSTDKSPHEIKENHPENPKVTSENQLKLHDEDSKKSARKLSHSETHEEVSNDMKEKMYRAKMMEFVGLKDAEYEAEDEVNYLAYYNQNALTSFGKEQEFNTNELIDVIPLAGLIQAGQSQTFTVVFFSYPDISFKTSLILYVDGGSGKRKAVEVVGSTAP